ncbi:MAG: aminotransferase class III-fold pyridoxal phosphate-dependent enzyme [Deltaproteobacteria bacterium]|nr:aminotransferase class III-fold pyridoxal phosphate-dependent enzyme [Deltaproteobacteria bacterium]
MRERETPHLAPGFQAIAAHSGIVVDHGEGCEIVDLDGNRFLDLVAGICVAALGYGHKRYVAALSDQMARTHCGSFTTEARVKALEQVHEVAPRHLTRLQLYSGGSEAVESAIRLARCHTGKTEVLSFWGGFHGKTSGTLAQMGSDFKHGLGPLAPGSYLTPYADCDFCPFRTTYPACGLLCVDFAREKIKRETTHRVAAILIEPMQGTAGNVIPPREFLQAVAALAKELGALLICDEMICGFGRTGKMFGHLHAGVEPDMLTLGKALGGGFPVSGLLVREDVAKAEPWSKPSFSSSSYGGNPLAGAAIGASLSIIRDERLVENAAATGEHLKLGLARLAEHHPALAHVRGEGLFIGFDLLDERGALWSHARCRELFTACLKRGLLTMAYAPRVRVNPPLLFNVAQADEALNILDAALTDVRA